MAEHTEAPGVAWIDMYKDGTKVSLTARADTTEEALRDLMACVAIAKAKWGLTLDRNGDTVAPTQTTQQQAPPPPPLPDEAFPFDADGDEHPVTPEPELGIGKNWGLVDRKPKASELNFNDTYEVAVDEFKATNEAVKFYVSGLEYPTLTHNMKSDYAKSLFLEIFGGWEPEPDDVRQPLPGGEAILQVQCTGPDKQTRNGNPYQNLAGVRRP